MFNAVEMKYQQLSLSEMVRINYC